MKTKRVELHISGHVQGVFYRQTTNKQAHKLSLTGYVKNLPNGDVECQVQGSDENLSLFIECCRKGPSQAQVQNCKVKWIAPLIEEKTFIIKY